MQQRSVLSQTIESPSPSHPKKPVKACLRQATPEVDYSQDSAGKKLSELTRVFNSVLLTSRTKRKRDFSSELYALMESPAFKAILMSIRQLAAVRKISERQATEQVIQAFRKVDNLWDEFMFREGVDQIRKPR